MHKVRRIRLWRERVLKETLFSGEAQFEDMMVPCWTQSSTFVAIYAKDMGTRKASVKNLGGAKPVYLYYVVWQLLLALRKKFYSLIWVYGSVKQFSCASKLKDPLKHRNQTFQINLMLKCLCFLHASFWYWRSYFFDVRRPLDQKVLPASRGNVA